MTTRQYDFFVIGGGSGGVRAARIASALGARVALCESSAMGGTCVNLGCVPKKLFAYASEYGALEKEARNFGWTHAVPTFDWPTLVSNKNAEIERLNGIYNRILVNAGVTVIQGHGQIIGPNEVEVAGTRYTTERILIATGSRAWRPDIPGIEYTSTSDELFHLPNLPKRIVIVGGGYIGVEFASIFSGLGVEVDVILRGDRILRGFDAESVSHLQSELQKRAIRFHFNHALRSVNQLKQGLRANTATDSFEADLILMATGRHPNTQALGLEHVGVQTNERGAIEVNECYQSSISSIYAVGDVIDRVQLTPTALEEGMRLAQYLYGDGPIPDIRYQGPPTAIFTKPEFATAGLTETEAKAHGDITVYTSNFRPLKQTIALGDARTFMKLIVERSTDRVLGCHMVGDGASEIIQGLSVALNAGATKRQFDETLGIHPTAAEEFVTMRTPRKK